LRRALRQRYRGTKVSRVIQLRRSRAECESGANSILAGGSDKMIDL